MQFSNVHNVAGNNFNTYTWLEQEYRGCWHQTCASIGTPDVVAVSRVSLRNRTLILRYVTRHYHGTKPTPYRRELISRNLNDQPTMHSNLLDTHTEALGNIRTIPSERARHMFISRKTSVQTIHAPKNSISNIKLSCVL